MSKEYIEAAEKVTNLADEFGQDYDLACLLRAKSSKIMKIAQDSGITIIKSSSTKHEKEKTVRG